MTDVQDEVNPEDDTETRAAEIESRAMEAPESVSTAAVIELLGDEAVETRRAGVRSFIELVRADEIDPRERSGALVSMLNDPDTEIRKTATLFAAELAEDFDAVEPVVPELIELAGKADAPGEQLVRLKALLALDRISRTNPDAVRPALPDLIEALEDDVIAARRHAVEAISQLAADDPERVGGYVTEISAVLDTDASPPEDHSADRIRQRQYGEARRIEQTQAHTDAAMIRQRAAQILAAIAERRPEAVEAVVEDVASGVGARHPRIRAPLVRTLAHVADSNPAVIKSAAPTIGRALQNADGAARTRIIRILAVTAEEFPEEIALAVAPVVPSIADAMEDSDAETRGFAVGVLAYVAEFRPDALEEYVSAIVEQLDAEEPYVRANAAWALGYLDAESAIEPLRELRETDPNDEIRDVAASALDMIEDETGRERRDGGASDPEAGVE